MSYIIPLNRSNLVLNGFNNTYEFPFRGSAANFVDTEVAIHSIGMYNSVYNIDTTYANNVVSVRMPINAIATQTVNITIPDGLYSYNNLSRFIQSKLKEAGAYLINAEGSDVHYIQLSANSAYYACQVDSELVPSTLPAGWSLPATGIYSAGSGMTLPSVSRVPILYIANQAFGDIIGFDAGSYPSVAQETLQTFLSNKTPQIHPVSSYIVRCNLINNKFTMPSDILGSFDKQGTSAGDLISYKPNEHLWLPVSDGSYANIRLTVVDQLGRFVRIRDNDINILLVIKQKK